MQKILFFSKEGPYFAHNLTMLDVKAQKRVTMIESKNGWADSADFVPNGEFQSAPGTLNFFSGNPIS